MVVRIGADCETDEAVLERDPCCPRDLCEIDLCDLQCNFVQLLPNGPLWDRAKAKGLEQFRQYTWCQPYCPDPEPCYTLVNYAVYNARRLHNLIFTALWPAIRESNPETASTTLDEWLDRLGWQDCYNNACRDPRLGNLTPYEIPGECGPIFCPVETPADLECAVKRGIVRSLMRLRMGIIKNLCSINWVIEPLGAVVTHRPEICVFDDGVTTVAITEELDCCRGAHFTICGIDGTIETCLPVDCERPKTRPRINTLVERNICDMPAGAQQRIRPNVLAAECIVRSLLPSWSACESNNLYRCDDCEPTTPPPL